MNRRTLFLLFAGCLLTVARLLPAETVEEKFDDGKVKAKYSTNDAGQRDGDYLEYNQEGKVILRSHYHNGELEGAYGTFFDSGKPKARATYKHDKLNGPYFELNERGVKEMSAIYLAGKLNGNVTHFENGKPTRIETFKDGEPVSSRSAAEIKKQLVKIAGRPANDQDAALRRLMQYRYLVGVPYENMALDPEYTKGAQAGAHVLEKLGRLDHHPPDPGGLPAAEYKLGSDATAHSNLAMGPKNLSEAVDMWMDDSDAKNIPRLGHRRWCINPPMLKTGFGISGRFTTLWAFDQNQPDPPDFDLVAYPAPRLMPVEFFAPDAAWSVSLNPKHFASPADTVKPSITLLDEKYQKIGDPLKLIYSHVDHEGMGINNCIIFQPDKTAVLAGRRYLVEIAGLLAVDGKTPVPLHYFVEFFNLQ